MRVVLIVLVVVATLAAVAMATVVIIARELGADSWVGPVSDHFDGRRFHNLDPLPDKTTGDLARWQRTRVRQPWAEWIEEPPGPRPAERINDGTIRVTWINHATLLVQMDGVNILTDPNYSDRASPFQWIGPRRHRAPAIRWDDLPPIDLVVVSHNHYDHMDLTTLRRLAARDSAPILVALGNTAYLATRRIFGTRDLDWWDTVTVGDVRTTAVPVQHWSARSRGDQRRTLWAGYVFEGPSGRVYFGGDTGYGRHFSLTRQRLGPMDVALLPIGAFMPVWFMKDNHVSPSEAVRASEELEARVAIPMHYGTWQLGDDGDVEPLQELEQALMTNEAQRAVWRIARHGQAEIIDGGSRPPDVTARDSTTGGL